jgi:hypothetical protein
MEARRALLNLGIFEAVRFVTDSAHRKGHAKIGVVVSEIPRKEYGAGQKRSKKKEEKISHMIFFAV